VCCLKTIAICSKKKSSHCHHWRVKIVIQKMFNEWINLIHTCKQCTVTLTQHGNIQMTLNIVFLEIVHFPKEHVLFVPL